ncbi:inactive dipeptidyl peptidase 10-like [Electrophorus electricus]|uniref:inactive dipeptidyl peptidase 10-like n=1 Tax=Electrophorus electricus TaxID=8005 RepID=UPI0015D06992|nr:inactive dipeptidyl peptidase 10-like [Electrophorus electricus]
MAAAQKPVSIEGGTTYNLLPHQHSIGKEKGAMAPKLQDLGDGSPERNWKGIGISLLVIVVVLSLISLSIFLLSKDDGSKALGSDLTLDDLFLTEFQVHSPEAQWISAVELIYKSRDGNVIKVDLRTNQTELIMKDTMFATFKASWFAVSPDLNYVLLTYDIKKVYRYSFLASYLIYNLHTREVHELNPPEVWNSVLQFASWGSKGQQLIYIFENNIYYQPDVKSSSLRLTSSGREALVFNGIPDWLYEEEVLRSPVAHWWSPAGSSLAFLTLNDTLVPNMVLPCFTGALYPRGPQYPYPKTGQVNPTVKLSVVILDGSSHTIELLPPKSLEKSEYYITMVQWVCDEKVTVRWLNRAQNTSILTLCNKHTGECARKHVLTSDKWIDHQNEKPVFSKDGAAFFVTLPIKHGANGSFHHLTMMSEQGTGAEVTIRHLTSGSWEVTKILAYDESLSTVYFLSTEGGASNRHLYRVSTVSPFHRECLTCSLFKPQCSYYDISLSPDSQKAMLLCAGPGVPRTTIHQLSDITRYMTLDSGLELRETLRKRRIPRREIRTLFHNNHELHLEISLPLDFNESCQHPLLFILDSEPGSQQVNERFRLDWDSVLVSSHDVIVARLDGRGSGFRGQKILQEVHTRLGVMEVQDQLAALEYLVKKPYIDGNRVGVFGKAYGGFLSSILLLSHGSHFRCAVAMAPIFDWRLYGSAFTERYFGFPANDESKYHIASLLPNTTSSEQVKFLIIHGTADASVHFQHSAELVKQLSVLNVNHTLQIFPDEGHDISSRHYMLRSVITFFRECFYDKTPVTVETREDD